MQSQKLSFQADRDPLSPALQEQQWHTCMHNIAVAHQRLMPPSPTPTVPWTRQQSYSRVTLATEDAAISSSNLTLLSPSWWFTGPNTI